MTSSSSQLVASDTNLTTSTHDKKNLSSESTTAVPVAVPAFDQAATKKLLRKLDLHLLPILALIYLLCFLDRTNVGNARLVKLEADLHMHGLDYNIAVAIFFPFYIAAEIPSNMMMKRFRPSIWITFIAVSWGLIMMCMGFVHNFQGLLACRVFLGVAEGGLFPGVSYYITMWYQRHECAFRMALFFSAATVAGVFGGLLARGISEMSGIGGKGGWAWIFILEGALTMCVGSIAYWVINDYPATSKFLTQPEKLEVERRLAEDSYALSSEFQLKFVGQALKDWKIWVYGVISLLTFIPLYSIAFFLPTVIKNLGFTNNAAQLMTVPPYILACIFTILGSYVSDKLKQRGIVLAIFEVIAAIGFVILATNHKPHIQYAGSFFAAAGTYPLIPLVGAWNSNNIGGSLKRGVGIAIQVGFGNFAGVVSAFAFLPHDAPRFVKGHTMIASSLSLAFVLTIFMIYYFRQENARRDRVLAHMGVSLEEYSNEMRWEEREKGDDAICYRFTT